MKPILLLICIALLSSGCIKKRSSGLGLEDSNTHLAGSNLLDPTLEELNELEQDKSVVGFKTERNSLDSLMAQLGLARVSDKTARAYRDFKAALPATGQVSEMSSGTVAAYAQVSTYLCGDLDFQERNTRQNLTAGIVNFSNTQAISDNQIRALANRLFLLIGSRELDNQELDTAVSELRAGMAGTAITTAGQKAMMFKWLCTAMLTATGFRI